MLLVHNPVAMQCITTMDDYLVVSLVSHEYVGNTPDTRTDTNTTPIAVCRNMHTFDDISVPCVSLSVCL